MSDYYINGKFSKDCPVCGVNFCDRTAYEGHVRYNCCADEESAMEAIEEMYCNDRLVTAKRERAYIEKSERVYGRGVVL